MSLHHPPGLVVKLNFNQLFDEVLAELVDALFNKQLDEHLDEQLNSNELFDELLSLLFDKLFNE